MSWSARLHRPVVLPDGKKIGTLSDARAYLLKLPKEQQSSEPVQAAAEAVLMAAEGRGPIMHANAAIAQAVYGKAPIPPRDPSKDVHWRRRSKGRK